MSTDVREAQKISILVTDDNQRMRESLRELLDTYDLQCQTAANGQQALNLMANQQFDLVLLDILMPKINGIQVMRYIHENYPDTDTIILSGAASFENAREAMRLGAIDFLNKPFNPAELIQLINQVAQQRQLKQKQAETNLSHNRLGINSIHEVEKTINELEEIIENEDRELTNSIINASPAVAFVWKNTSNWPTQFVSENVINLLGYSAQEFITGKVTYKNIIHPDDVERVNSEIVVDEETVTFNHKPYRVITKSGLVKWVDESSSVVRDEQGQITHYKGILIDVTEAEIARQKLLKKQESLEHIAHHDQLTGLANRLLLLDRLQQSIKKIKRVKKQLALLYIDLDKFKEINDSLGHSAGDEVLKLIAKRLTDNVREIDTVARIGGDEFVILMESINGIDDVRSIAQKLNQSLQQSIHWDVHELFVTSSIGISLATDETEDAEELMKKADIAMYESKKLGRNTYQFYQHSSVAE